MANIKISTIEPQDVKVYIEIEATHKELKEDEFIDYYMGADVFLIDDFQDMPKTKSEQEVFFKIFGNVVENNKQIVITSDRPVDEIKALNKNIIKKLLSKSGIIINLFESALESN